MAVKRELLVVMKGAPDELLKSLDRAKRSLQQFGSEMKAIGSSLSAGLTLPLAGAGVAITKFAGDFEAGMSLVRAKTGATSDELEKLKTLAKDLGATTKFSATEAADAMAFLAQAGFKTNEIMSSLPGILDLAAAGGLELGRAADIASNVLSGFGLSADQAGRAADVLAFAANNSNQSVEQLGSAMSYVAPVAASLGISMEETAAMIGKLSDAGIQGEKAGTGLRAAMLALLKPSTEAQKVFEKLGIDLRDSNNQLRPMTDILGEMAAKSKDAADFTAVFGREASTSALVLAKAAPEIRTFTGEIESAGGTAARVSRIMEDNLKGSFTQLKSALEGLAIAIGDSGLLAFLRDLVDRATSLVRGLSQANPELLKWGTIIAGLAAAIGPVVLGVGIFAGSLSSISALLAGTAPVLKGFMGALSAGSGIASAIATAFPGAASAITAVTTAASGLIVPIGLAAAAVAASIATYVTFRDEIDEAAIGLREFGKDALAFAKASIKPMVAALSEVNDEIGEGATAVRDYLIEWVKATKIFKDVQTAFDQLYPSIVKVVLTSAGAGVGGMIQLLVAGFDKLRERAKAYADEQAMVDRVLQQSRNNMALLADEMLATAVTTERVKTAAAGLGSEGASAIERFSGVIKEMVSAETIEFVEKWRASWQKAVDEIAGAPKTIGAAAKALDEMVTSLAYAGDGALIFADQLPRLNTNLRFAGEGAFLMEEKLKKLGVTTISTSRDALAQLEEKLRLAQEAFAANLITVDELRKVQDEWNAATGRTGNEWQVLGKQISTILTDLSKGLADAFLGAKSFEDAFTQAAKAIAEAILRTIIEGALNLMLESIKGNVNAVQGLINKFKEFFGLFGGGKSSPSPGGAGPGGGQGGVTVGGGDPISVITGIVQALVAILDAPERFDADVPLAQDRVVLIPGIGPALHRLGLDLAGRHLHAADVLLDAGELEGLEGCARQWPEDRDRRGFERFAGRRAPGGAAPDPAAVARHRRGHVVRRRQDSTFMIEGETYVQTDLLRTISDQLEGISLALTGSSRPPETIVNIVGPTFGAGMTGRAMLKELQRTIEQEGLGRSGALALGLG